MRVGPNDESRSTEMMQIGLARELDRTVHDFHSLMMVYFLIVAFRWLSGEEERSGEVVWEQR
jgi:hypothetical protein